MKKFIAAAFLIMGAVGVKAQKLEIIPKAGINIANQSIKGTSNDKSKIGFQGGVAVNIYTGAGAFSVQPEINFIGKGTTIKSEGSKEKYNLNYLELPVLAKYSFGPVYVNAGPSIGLLLVQSDKVKAAYGDLKKIDFGVQMGAGLAIPAGKGKFIIDGRYNLGLSNISDVNGASIKNRGISASLGYAIPF